MSLYLGALPITNVDYNKTLSSMGSTTGQCFLFWNKLGNSWGYAQPSICTIGTTPPSAGVFWNTSTNTIKYYEGGVDYGRLYSIPFAIVTRTSGTPSSLDKTLNGFSYFSNRVIALPGVKGLAPNGRNADGSLKSTAFTVSNVLTFTNPYGAQNIYCIMNNASLAIAAKSITHYNEEQNLLIDDSTGNILPYCVFGTAITQADNRFTSFTPKTAFHALDYNDSSTISGWSMPSTKYIDLTLGASGTTYTAPANGWFNISKNTNQTEYTEFVNEKTGFTVCDVATPGFRVVSFSPARKGDIVRLNYNAGGTLNIFRFYYAEGEI